MKKPKRSSPEAGTICPVRILLNQFADRWAMQVVFALAEGPVRFNALRRALDGVTQKVLGQTLQRLDRNGLVDRFVLATKPIAVQYSLSPTGKSLLPLVKELRAWAKENATEFYAAHRRFDAQGSSEKA